MKNWWSRWKLRIGYTSSLFLDRTSQSIFFQRVFKQLDLETEQRKAVTSAPPGIITKFSLATSAAFILAFFIYQISFYFNPQRATNDNPRVWNLTRSKVEWDVYYGDSPICGKIPCVFTETGRTVTKRMVLPAREFPLLDWKRGQKIYLSKTLDIPEVLLNAKEPLALYSLHVWAEKFTMYLNGEVFHEGGVETLFVSIPYQLLMPKMTFSFEIDPGDLPYQGISNKFDLLLGAKSELLLFRFFTTELSSTFRLWFILPELILCFFLICIYLGFYRYKEIFYLILYLGGSSLYFLTPSVYYPKVLNEILPGFVVDQLAKCISQVALLVFIHEYFRRHSRIFNRLIRLLTLSLGILTVGFLLFPDFRMRVDQTDFLKFMSKGLYVVSFSYGLFLSGLTAFYLRKKEGVSEVRKAASITLYMIFLTVVVLVFPFDLKFSVPKELYFFENVCSLVLSFTLTGVVLFEFAIAFPERNFFKGFAFRFVNPKIANDAYRSLQSLEPVRREITTLVVDIRNFTAFCEESSPEHVGDVLSRIRNVFVRCAARHHGYLDKFTGDGALILYGVLSSSKDFQLEAVRSAFEIMESYELLKQKTPLLKEARLKLGIGISSGTAIVGEVGNEIKSEYTALGSTVNRAFRIEGLCKELRREILVDESTLSAVASHVLSRPFFKQAIRGMGKRTVHVLLGLRDEKGDLVPYKWRRRRNTA